jgi:hypothetical protein
MSDKSSSNDKTAEFTVVPISTTASVATKGLQLQELNVAIGFDVLWVYMLYRN